MTAAPLTGPVPTAASAPTADAAASAPTADELRAVLDGRWAHVKEASRRELRDVAGRPDPGATVEEHRARIWDQMGVLAASGRVKEGFVSVDGRPLDVGAGVTAIAMLGHADLSLMVKAGVQWGLFGGALKALGTQVHHERYLDAVMDLELPGCFAMTESGHGSDVQRLETTATYDTETHEFVVSTPHPGARKEYIGNAARDGRMAVVFAQLVTGGERRGVHALLVPIRDEAGRPCSGVRIEDCGVKGGLNGVDNGRITFDSVRVPREALLDRYGQVAEDGTYSSPIEDPSRRFFAMIGTLVRGRLTVGAAAASAAKNALAIAVRHGERRRQFERPGTDEEVTLLDYRAHQRRLLVPLATTYALHVATERLLVELHDELQRQESLDVAEVDATEQRRLESKIAGLKAATTWNATRTIQACSDACGGAGYLAENALPQLKADTDVFTTFEGDNTVLLQLVTKGLLTSYRQQFGSLDTLGTVRFVVDRVRDTVLERTPVRALVEQLADAAPGRDDDMALCDREWELTMFRFRERHVLDGLARRLRAATSQGRDGFDAFNEAQDHVLAAAQAHVARLVLEAFDASVRECTDERVAGLLDRVCHLYALSELESDRAWFLEHSRLSPGRSKALVGAVNDLCAELRPHARLLVDAFAIPEEWLAAEIASAD